MDNKIDKNFDDDDGKSYASSKATNDDNLSTVSKSTNMTNESEERIAREKEIEQRQIRLGIIKEVDLLKSDLVCIRILIIRDFIVVVCKGLKMLIYKLDILDSLFKITNIDLSCLSESTHEEVVILSADCS